MKVDKTLQEYRKAYNKVYFSNGSPGFQRQSDNRYLNYLLSGRIKNPKPNILEKHGIHKVGDTYQFTSKKLEERNAKSNQVSIPTRAVQETVVKKKEQKKKKVVKQPTRKSSRLRKPVDHGSMIN